MSAQKRLNPKSKPIDRKPRYRHAREDDNLVHVQSAEADETFECRYQDLSESGIRFVARRELAIKKGDVVEVMIPPPAAEAGKSESKNKKPIVARARIVRYDGHREYAARFEKLAMDDFRVLVESLRDGFERARYASLRATANVVAEFLSNRWAMLVALLIVACVACAAMSWLVAPRGNYRPDKTVPWAERTF